MVTPSEGHQMSDQWLILVKFKRMVGDMLHRAQGDFYQHLFWTLCYALRILKQLPGMEWLG
jgi:hypothetical protein